jgi:hypothetical protein
MKGDILTSPPWGLTPESCDVELMVREQNNFWVVADAWVPEDGYVMLHLPDIQEKGWTNTCKPNWELKFRLCLTDPGKRLHINKPWPAKNVNNFCVYGRVKQNVTTRVGDNIVHNALLERRWVRSFVQTCTPTTMEVRKNYNITTGKREIRTRSSQLGIKSLMHLLQMFGRGHPNAPATYILDPFSGTGSTAVACSRLGINCVCLDIDAQVVGVANTWLDESKKPATPSSAWCFEWKRGPTVEADQASESKAK